MIQNKNAYFKNISTIGNLYLDHCFLTFEGEPILFTCVDNKENLYLCLCSEIRYQQKWIVSEINTSILRSLVEQKIDITDALTKKTTVVVISTDVGNVEHSTLIDTAQLDELDLPLKGTMLKCKSSSVMDYVTTKCFEQLSASLNNAPEVFDANTLKKICYDDSTVTVTVEGSSTFKSNKSTENGFTKEYSQQLLDCVDKLLETSAADTSTVNHQKMQEIFFVAA